MSDTDHKVVCTVIIVSRTCLRSTLAWADLARVSLPLGVIFVTSVLSSSGDTQGRVSSTGGGGQGEASPPNSLASPPKKRLTISLHHR